jgi:hypothetical protein
MRERGWMRRRRRMRWRGGCGDGKEEVAEEVTEAWSVGLSRWD